MALLEVRDLQVRFRETRVLRGIDFDLAAGETLGVAGESGCGKSMTAFALMGMTPPPGSVSGSIRLDGRELLGRPEREWRKLRGKRLALVMQDPFTSLNPMMRAGDQIGEALRLHAGLSRSAARARAIELLDEVGVPVPDAAARRYPHQLSGGQRQRVVIAMAFASKPEVLIADEPTTALDVTLQAQILRLLRDLQRREGTAVIIISHDVGAIAAVAHRMAVFYAGQIVELGSTEAVLRTPAMPYTRALLQALPAVGRTRLLAIPGSPPDLADLPAGCPFGPRCEFRFERCDAEPPRLELGAGHGAACWLAAAAPAGDTEAHA